MQPIADYPTQEQHDGFAQSMAICHPASWAMLFFPAGVGKGGQIAGNPPPLWNSVTQRLATRQ